MAGVSETLAREIRHGPYRPVLRVELVVAAARASRRWRATTLARCMIDRDGGVGEWRQAGRQALDRSIARSPSSPAGSQASDAHWLRQARGKDLAGGYEAVPLVWCMHLAPDRSFSSSQRGPPRILYQQSVSRQERRRTASAARVVFDGCMICVRVLLPGSCVRGRH